MNYKLKFPACFPKKFLSEILPQDLRTYEPAVYRVCKTGTICKESFMGTFEETVQGLRPKPKDWENKLNDPGTYSTSCSLTKESGVNALKTLRKYYPPCTLAVGYSMSST